MSEVHRPWDNFLGQHKTYIVLKFAAIVICISLFIILMSDVWKKYSTKLTSTGFQVIEHPFENKDFPCFAIQSTYPYKKKGFYWSTKDYLENTFALEDIFDPTTIIQLKNSSSFTLKEIHSMLNGRIFVVCPLTLFKTFDRITLNLKKAGNLQLSIFQPGDEFWFMFSRFLVHASHTLVDTQKMSSADVAIAEQRKKFLMKASSPCREYIDGGFALCVKDALVENFARQLQCILPGFEETVSPKAGLTYCTNRTAARIAYYDYIRSVYAVMEKPWSLGCPASCTQSAYDINVKYYHENAFIQVEEEDFVERPTFFIDLFYSTLNVEEHVETLVYDIGTFLAAAGGNLGLMLGVSCLSILYSMINILRGQRLPD